MESLGGDSRECCVVQNNHTVRSLSKSSFQEKIRSSFQEKIGEQSVAILGTQSVSMLGTYSVFTKETKRATIQKISKASIFGHSLPVYPISQCKGPGSASSGLAKSCMAAPPHH